MKKETKNRFFSETGGGPCGQKGTTLVELLVAMMVFSAIMVLFASSISLILTSFKKTLANQVGQDELRYSTEFMSREIRTAQCPSGVTDCQMFLLNDASDIGQYNGTIYPALDFTNYRDQQVRYIFSQDANGKGVIGRRCVIPDAVNPSIEKDCDDPNIIVAKNEYQPLTSGNVDVKGMSFIINGDLSVTASSEADQRQPLLTVLITAEIKEKDITKTIYFQTSISPRRLQS